MKVKFLEKEGLRKSAIITSMVVLAIILIAGSFTALTSFAQMQGNDNEEFLISWNNSYVAAKMGITTTIKNSNTQGIQTDGCPTNGLGQFSLQLTDGGFIGSHGAVQEGVSVNTQGGFSCFGVSEFKGSSTYCDGFAIGFSSEFYTAGNSVTMKIDSDSSGNWKDAYLYVASDTWVIYPSMMTKCDSGTVPSQTINQLYTYNIVNLVSTKSFTAGSGTIGYYSTQVPNLSGCGRNTAETSNMYYGTIAPGGPDWQQNFATTNLSGMCQ